MRLILWLLVLLFAFTMAYDAISDGMEEIVASNSGTTWAPVVLSGFASVSYYWHQYRAAREAYAMQLKLFPKETETAKGYFRIAKASERLREYKGAAKYYKKLLDEFPNHPLASKTKVRLENVEKVYLELLE